MTQSVDQILQSALTLSESEQLQLIASLVAAVEERGLPPFDNSWLAEIRRRSDEFDTSEVTPIPWHEVKEQARRMVSEHG